jgi:hypothetical protein
MRWEPPLAARAGHDTAECNADQFACAQAGRVTEIEQKAQTLCGGNRPAIRPFETIGNRADQLPLSGRKGARDVQLTITLRAAYPEGRGSQSAVFG